MHPALRGCRKAWVHLGTQKRLTSGGTPLQREGLLGGGLRGDSSLCPALHPLPLQGPLPLRPTHGRSALWGPQGRPRLLDAGRGLLEGAGQAGGEH